jgi:cytochrome c-type biogenesis protein CcmH/NrfG
MATIALQSMLDKVRQALQNDAVDTAIGMLQHTLVYFPQLIEGHRLLGEAYLRASQHDLAELAFERVLRSDPENVAAYYGLGLVRWEQGQALEAMRLFERALEIQPNLIELRTQLRRFYDQSDDINHQFRLSHGGLGRLYARGHLYDEAISEFRAALDDEPERIEIQVALAEALWRMTQDDEAAQLCRELIAQEPDLLKPVLLLSLISLEAGERDEGEALWRRAATYDPEMIMARALFEELPPIRIEEPVLPPFNESEWPVQTSLLAGEQQPPDDSGIDTDEQQPSPAFAEVSEIDIANENERLESQHDAVAPSDARVKVYDASTEEAFHEQPVERAKARQIRTVGQHEIGDRAIEPIISEPVFDTHAKLKKSSQPDLEQRGNLFEEVDFEDEWELAENVSPWNVNPERGEAEQEQPAEPVEDEVDLASLPEGAQAVASMSQEALEQPTEQTGSEDPLADLSDIYAQLDTEPDNDRLRLAVARMSWQAHDDLRSFEHYKQLVKRKALLDDVVADLQDAISDTNNVDMLRKLHRLLGDAYMKQRRLSKAMEAYSWTP